ncbi:spore germination protein [Cohnella xylanilytica]|uniref:Ger(x)C family spore germination protein n=1 Tax=Cohnella xylanilytica TaxID=557555 RepID=UPI001B2EFA77|nr:Ger(x)C family spore germination protein [Cohnella xylanilytica]GIO11575.1 spore germination protein [Cohnella xylanilytica]
MTRAWIFVPIVLALLLSGCMNRSFKDIDKRLFVTAIGVDRAEENGPYKISLKLGIPSKGSEKGPGQAEVVSEQAESIPEALRLLKAKFDKELDFNHTKMLVFGEPVVRRSVDPLIDYFSRRRDIQGIAFVAVGSPNAEEVLKVTPKSETFPGNSLFLTFEENGTSSAYSVTAYLFDCFRRLNEEGLDPYMPVIEPEGDRYRINRVALFDKTRLVGILSPRETKSFKELLQSYRKMDMIVRSPRLDFTLFAEKYDRDFSIRSGSRDRIAVRVKIAGIVEQTKAPVFEQDWSKFEVAAGQEVNEQYLSMLRRLQSWKVDPFGFGLLYKAARYRGDADWKRWQRIYPSIEFDVRTKVKITGTGILK